MHYAFDAWITRMYPSVPWCRYADDGLLHCKTEREAQEILHALTLRFAECGLEMHPEKTKIVYCKDGKRKQEYPNTKFDFLGYQFRTRVAKRSNDNHMFISFVPAVSPSSLKSMRAKIRKLQIRNRSELSLEQIALIMNPLLRGWINYYGKFRRSDLYPLVHHFNGTLVAWAMRKYKRLARHKTRAGLFLERIAKNRPDLFVPWQLGMVGGFV